MRFVDARGPSGLWEKPFWTVVKRVRFYEAIHIKLLSDMR